MALVQLTNALKLVIVEKVHVHSGTTAALATRPLHERGLGQHERSIGTLKQTVAGLEKSSVLAAAPPWSPGPVITLGLGLVAIGRASGPAGGSGCGL